MSYDLKSIQAPRLTGVTLRAFTALIENDYLNFLVINKLLQDSGVATFRKRFIDEPPTFYPIRQADKGGSEESPSAEPGGITEHPVSDEIAASQGDDTFRFHSIDDFASLYAEGRVTPVDIAERVIQAIRSSNSSQPPLRAIIAYSEQDILRQAEESTALLKKNQARSILEGVPVAVKDEVDMVPFGTTVGTSFLGKEPVKRDAYSVKGLREAGALLIGKANMHEIGLGVTGFNAHHGMARNPYHNGHYTGGSSSGSAAAVASGLCPVALGADGGGSVRIPAAFCGVVGLKPTFGRVSESGAAPLCWSVAHIGPIGASVVDVARAYWFMAGPDPADSHSLRQPKKRLPDFNSRDLKGVKIGVYEPWFNDARPEIVSACRKAINLLQDAGAEIVEVEIPDLELFRVAHVIIIISEMIQAMSRYMEKHGRDFGLDVRINMAIGRKMTTADYIAAQRVRTYALEVMNGIFANVDVIATPATGCPAPPARADVFPDGESDLPVLSEIMRFAPLPNLTGNPAIALPVGYNTRGLPLSLQLMGDHWREDLLLQLGHIIESKVERQKPQTYYSLL